MIAQDRRWLSIEKRGGVAQQHATTDGLIDYGAGETLSVAQWQIVVKTATVGRGRIAPARCLHGIKRP